VAGSTLTAAAARLCSTYAGCNQHFEAVQDCFEGAAAEHTPPTATSAEVEVSPDRRSSAASTQVPEIDQIKLRLSDMLSKGCAKPESAIAIVCKCFDDCDIGSWNLARAFFNSPVFERYRTALFNELTPAAYYCIFDLFKSSLAAVNPTTTTASTGAASSTAAAEPSASHASGEFTVQHLATEVTEKIIPNLREDARFNSEQLPTLIKKLEASVLQTLHPPTVRTDLEFSFKEPSGQITFLCFVCSTPHSRTLQLRPNNYGLSLHYTNFVTHFLSHYKRPAADSNSPQPQKQPRRQISGSASPVNLSRASSGSSASAVHVPRNPSAAAPVNGMQQPL
jgi:hypothetical protein